jgi:pyruvate dehydrogenase E2 component (dihydrolipoamide acetyltransferase)
MLQEIVMPQLGLTMTEGAVSAWLKKPGDRVERGEILFLVQTDKVEMEVESFVSGLVDHILIEPDVVVQVGTVIAIVDDGRSPKTDRLQGGEPVVAAPLEHAMKPQVVTTKALTQTDRPISPRARKLANSLGIDLTLLKPSKGGRITEDDVRSFQEETAAKPSRAVIAQRMVSSVQSAPHFYLTTLVDANNLVQLRNANIGLVQDSHGVKITYTDFFLRALALALREKPGINSFWGSNQVEQFRSVDVAFAVQTPHGLVTPVIKKADTLSFAELAIERSTLTERARARKLTLSEMEGGSATLSNLGAYGIDEFHPILNPPQSVMLATGRIAKRPIVIDDVVQARPTVHLTLAADHRVLDGVEAAEFLERVRNLLENPGETLL